MKLNHCQLSTIMKITVIKKVKADGNLCRKSAKVLKQLQQEQLLNHIDRIVFAHEINPNSEGLILASKYQVNRAPFFIVEQENNEPQIYTSYALFLTEVLKHQVEEKEVVTELMATSPDLDFI